MENKHEKDKVMSNLRQLKGTEMEFGKISVTEDHTIEERQDNSRVSTYRLSL